MTDEGTHFYGDDCPGGHGAAGLAGVDLDDQLTPQEANKQDERVRDVLAIACELAETALCRRSKVGALIIRDGTIVTAGRNGTVDGASCLDGGCPRGLLDYDQAPLGTPSAGAAKCLGIHAEQAAILDAARRGVRLEGTTIVVSKPPCRTCRMHIELAGIAQIVVAPTGGGEA